jgi:hypothetical protein
MDRDSENEADAECLYRAAPLSGDHGGGEWIICQNCLKWAQTIRWGPRLCMTGASKMGIIWGTLVSKYIANNDLYLLGNNFV